MRDQESVRIACELLDAAEEEGARNPEGTAMWVVLGWIEKLVQDHRLNPRKREEAVWICIEAARTLLLWGKDVRVLAGKEEMR